MGPLQDALRTNVADNDESMNSVEQGCFKAPGKTPRHRLRDDTSAPIWPGEFIRQLRPTLTARPLVEATGSDQQVVCLLGDSPLAGTARSIRLPAVLNHSLHVRERHARVAGQFRNLWVAEKGVPGGGVVWAKRAQPNARQVDRRLLPHLGPPNVMFSCGVAWRDPGLPGSVPGRPCVNACVARSITRNGPPGPCQPDRQVQQAVRLQSVRSGDMGNSF